MGDVATLAGIAKATLYNHFRTRDDVYAAVVVARGRAIAAAVSESSAAVRPRDCGGGNGLLLTNPAIRRLARDEPAVLAAFATPGEGPAWTRPARTWRGAVAAGRCHQRLRRVDLVLRYLTSQLLSPSDARRSRRRWCAAHQPSPPRAGRERAGGIGPGWQSGTSS